MKIFIVYVKNNIYIKERIIYSSKINKTFPFNKLVSCRLHGYGQQLADTSTLKNS